MPEIELIVKLLNGALSNTNVQTFLLKLGAVALAEGLKKVAGRHKCDPSLASQTWDALRNTMQMFYEDKGFEYDEKIVMMAFCEQYSIQDGISNETNFRAILEETINLSVTDEDYRKWLTFFYANCSSNQILFNRIMLHEDVESKVFSDQELVFQRLEAKLLRYADSKHSETDNCLSLEVVFEQLDALFDNSWKEELLRLITRLPHQLYNQDEINKKLSFIRSNEDCDEVLIQVEELLRLYDFKKAALEDENSIREMLKWPSYDKVLVVTGTTGSGKNILCK